MVQFLISKRWLLLSLLVGIGMHLLPIPQGLSAAGMNTIIIAVVATILLITEPMPLPTVALLLTVSQVLILKISPNKAAQSLFSDSVLFIMGTLMLAVAIVKQKLDKRIALAIIWVTGSKTRNIVIGISLVSGLMASFVGGHTVAAMMLPVVLRLIQLSGEEGKACKKLHLLLLFSVTYSCGIAAIATLSAGARNVVMANFLHDFFYKAADPSTFKYNLTYFQWMKFFYPLFLIQLAIMIFILLKIFPTKITNLRRATRIMRVSVGREGKMQMKHWTTIVLLVFCLIGWIGFSGTIGMGTIAISCVCMFLILGLVTWDDLNSGINWGTVLLYGSTIALGIQLREQGSAAWLAHHALSGLAFLHITNKILIFAFILLAGYGVTNCISSGAAVAILGPVVLEIAVATRMNPFIAGFGLVAATGISFMSVIGTPSNTIVYSSGYLQASDFVKAGFWCSIIALVVFFIAANTYWQFLI